MKLIPNNITVGEQFALKYKFIKMVENWADSTRQSIPYDLEKLQEASGVKCKYVKSKFMEKGYFDICGFDVVDREAYLIFLLKWS